MAKRTTTKAAAATVAGKAAAPAPALQGIALARHNVAAKAAAGIGVTLHTTGAPIKGLAAEPVVAKPQRRMLRTIAKIHPHPGVAQCHKRYHLYKVGMTLLDCKRTEGLVVSDVTYWVGLGYMELREPTDAEYNAAVEAWAAERKAAMAAEQQAVAEKQQANAA